MTQTSNGLQDGTNGKETRRPRSSIAAFQRFSLAGAWLIVIVVFDILEPDVFFTMANFSSIFGSQAVLVVLTLGLLIPLRAGAFDLSIAAVLQLSAMTTAVLNANHGWPIAAAIAIALAAGLLVGVVNGWLVGILDLNSLIVTLGTATFVQGIVFFISDSETVSGVDQLLSEVVVGIRPLGIPLQFYYALVFAGLIWYLFEYTPIGRKLLFLGSNRTVARLLGLRVKRLVFASLIAAALISSLAGVMYVGTLGGANPTSGRALLLPAYAAAFLGATAIKPGQFNAFGTLVAVYFLVTGVSGLQILGVRSYVQDLFYGAALLIAITISTLVRRRTEVT